MPPIRSRYVITEYPGQISFSTLEDVPGGPELDGFRKDSLQTLLRVACDVMSLPLSSLPSPVPALP